VHPADQFEALKKLAEERGFGAEEIAARFGEADKSWQFPGALADGSRRTRIPT
jgi:hypothetical protein